MAEPGQRDDPPALGGAEGEELAAASQRSLRADRALAAELRRPEAGGPAASSGYLGRLGQRLPLAPEAERELVAAAKAGDRRARGRLVEAFVPLVAAVARNYRVSPQVERMELIQEGVVGLLRALERFEPERGRPFWAYAAFWVRQAMQQLVAELTRPAVLSDRALRSLARLRDAHGEALAASGREPSRQELATRSGLALDQVDDLLAVAQAPRSLEAPVAAEDGAVGTFGDLISDPLAEDEYERVLQAIETEELLALLSGLSERERDVVRARYGLEGPEESLRQVGARLGLSAERVRQLERRALGKLAAGAGVDTAHGAS